MSRQPSASRGTQPLPAGQQARATRPLPAGQQAAGTVTGTPAVLPLVPGFGRPTARPRPLPDAVAVHMLAIPDSAPPYDDELGAGQRLHLAGGGDPRGSGAAGGRPLPGRERPPGDGPAPGDGQPVTDEQPPGDGQLAGDGPAPGDGPEGPERPRLARAPGRPPPPGQAPPAWPSKFAQVLAETLAGSRPPRQITPWTTERARRHIQRLGPMLAAGERPRVRRVVTFRPTSDAVEMTVIVSVGPKVRAIAVRLERDGPRVASPGRDARPARWVAVAVEAA